MNLKKLTPSQQQIETEIWKQIPIAANYEASTLGRIRRGYGLTGTGIRPGHILHPWKKNTGYLEISLGSRKAKRKRFPVHLLIARTFLGKRPKGFHINHKDLNKQNNRLINLEYVTCRENALHAIKNNAYKNGHPFSSSENGRHANECRKRIWSKFNPIKIRKIRLEYAQGLLTQREMAIKWRTSQRYISLITTGKARLDVE